MPILVDGHNLIGRLPDLSLEDPDDEDRLIRRLMSFSARAGKRITVVFDPGDLSALKQARRYGGVEVIFASYRSGADAVIAGRVSASSNPREWLVITSDQQLAEEVMRQGARVRSAEAFAAELDAMGKSAPEQEDTHLSAEQVEAWLTLFTKRRRKRPRVQ